MWNKGFVTGIWPYTLVGAGQKPMGSLLPLHLMVSLKCLQASGANSRGRGAGCEAGEKTNWNAHLFLATSNPDDTAVCRKCWCSLLRCCTCTWLRTWRNWRRELVALGLLQSWLWTHANEVRQQISDNVGKLQWNMVTYTDLAYCFISKSDEHFSWLPTLTQSHTGKRVWGNEVPV